MKLMLIRKISVSIFGTIPSFLWKNQSPKANNYLFKSYGLVSYKVDAYKKNKCLCFNFRHNSMFALKVLRAGILIKLTKSKEGKTKGKIIKGGPLMWKIGFYISAQKHNYILRTSKLHICAKLLHICAKVTYLPTKVPQFEFVWVSCQKQLKLANQIRTFLIKE